MGSSHVRGYHAEGARVVIAGLRDDDGEAPAAELGDRRPHRIEIWFYRAGDDLCLSTAPARRDWYANVLVHPRITIRLKRGVRAHLPATGVPVRDPAVRGRVLHEIVDELRHPDNGGGVQAVIGTAEDWIDGGPLVRIDLDDRSLLLRKGGG